MSPRPMLARARQLILAALALYSLLASSLLYAQLPQHLIDEGYRLEPLAGGLSGRVTAVHAVGDDIYYGGSFTLAYNGANLTYPVKANYIARWDGAAWHPLAGGVNSRVYAIASAADGSIYVGGDFTHATQTDGSTIQVKHIARFKNGEWSAVGHGAENTVFSLAVVERTDGGHDLYAGGYFTSVTDSSGSKTITHIARWDGEAWHALAAGTSH